MASVVVAGASVVLVPSVAGTLVELVSSMAADVVDDSSVVNVVDTADVVDGSSVANVVDTGFPPENVQYEPPIPSSVK